MIGKTLAHYNILSQLGEGGMGEVYLAEDTRLKRQVALKVLPEALRKDVDRLRRFRREGVAALHAASRREDFFFRQYLEQFAHCRKR